MIIIFEIENFNVIIGKGVEVMVEGRKILIVSLGYLKENNIFIFENFVVNDIEMVVFLVIDN